MIAKISVITLSTVKTKDIAKSNEYQSSKFSSSHETFMAKRSVWNEVLFSIISHFENDEAQQLLVMLKFLLFNF